MTLAETLPQNLSDLPAGGATSHEIAADDWNAELNLDRTDGLASVVRSLKVTRQTPSPAGATLAGWGDHVAERVHGLLEDVRVIEVDSTIDRAILRSETPAVQGGRRSYYEIELHGTDAATVQRFTADRDAGTPRQTTGFTLTHEVLGRLVDDLTSAAAGS